MLVRGVRAMRVKFHPGRYYSQSGDGGNTGSAGNSGTGNAGSATSSGPRFAVVGSGPAGFYTAYRILTKLPQAKVDMFESLPMPFGLARFGVAPDHPEVKNCQEKFEEVGAMPNFRFFGNVTVGQSRGDPSGPAPVSASSSHSAATVSVKALASNYNGIVFAYGSANDRKLGVSGEELPGVISARDFVGWYNGHPDYQSLDPPLENASTVSIIGNGNVALDVARLLLRNPDLYKTTDITEQAYYKLKHSKVTEVHLFARRGLLQTAFTSKELRELIRDPDTKLEIDRDQFIEPYRPYISQLPRKLKRVVDMIDRAHSEEAAKTGTSKRWHLHYLMSPSQFYYSQNDPRLLSSVRMEKNSLVQDSIDSPATAVGTGDTELFPTDLAFRSIGYKSAPLDGFDEFGMEFDHSGGRIVNDGGRVYTFTSGRGEVLSGFYVSGWVRTGPTGVIATTMMDSFAVAEALVQDYNEGRLNSETRPGFEGLDVKGRVVTWQDWLKIDSIEKQQGEADGKPRAKILDPVQAIELLG